MALIFGDSAGRHDYNNFLGNRIAYVITIRTSFKPCIDVVDPTTRLFLGRITAAVNEQYGQCNMIKLPSPYTDVGGYAEALLTFIDNPLFRQITGDIHVNDALIHDAWGALPPEWTGWWSSVPDHRQVQQNLIDSIDESIAGPPAILSDQKHQANSPLQGRPASLTRWLEAMQSLSLPRLQQFRCGVDLPVCLTDRMKTKKIDEVSTAVAYIRGVCQANDITRIIDMGSGQGYLSVSLAFLFPDLKVLAIDGSEAQLAASRAAAASLDLPEQRIKHMRRYIDGSPTLSEELTAWADGEKCMLVGLHACGNLSEHMLRYFATVPCITQLGAVGCCYNHIVPRSASCPEGFPISQKMRAKDVKLSATALMTGCQAPNNWEKPDLSKEESGYSRRRFYRAILEKIFHDKGIELDKDNRPIWGVRKGDLSNFRVYAHRVIDCLGVDRGRVPDSELDAYEGRYRDCNGKIAILWTLSVMCCKVVESVIAVDRYLFLTESGATGVEVLPIFDYKVSPRNLMLIASKSTPK